MFRLPPHPELHTLFEALGYSAGFGAYRLARRRGGDVVNEQQRWSVIAAAVVGALFGSRVLGLLEQAPRMHIALSQFLMPSGGKTVVGGLLGGWLGVEITKKVSGIHARTGDLFAIPLCIGIGVGRVGCLLAGLADDTYGKPTSLPWGVDFGDGIARHPTQAYEILFVAALALGLLYLKGHPHENGVLFRVFMAAYLSWRLVVDFLKPEPLVGGMNLIQWACVLGLVLLTFGERERFWGEHGGDMPEEPPKKRSFLPMALTTFAIGIGLGLGLCGVGALRSNGHDGFGNSTSMLGLLIFLVSLAGLSITALIAAGIGVVGMFRR